MLLEASAGTGKTYALENMVARLVSQKNPVDIDSILILTYTNRAAREMKERIRRILSNYAGDSSRNTHERELCAGALSRFDSAAICTIHGFCQMVLSTWPFESSAPFHQNLLLDGSLENRLTWEWLASKNSTLQNNALFKAAYNQCGSVEKISEDIVTRMMKITPGSQLLPDKSESDALRKLLKQSLKPKHPLNKAATKFFSTPWSDDAIKTLIKESGGPNKNSKSLEAIRKHLMACSKFTGILEICDAMFSDPAKVSISNHFCELLFYAEQSTAHLSNPESIKLQTALKDLIHILGPYLDFRPNAGSDKKVVCLLRKFMSCAFIDEAQHHISNLVEQEKNRTGQWGYADLITRVAESVEQNNSILKSRLRERYKAILIDEFQDTDPQQWSLFKSIFDTDENLMVLIGDPKQSIYGFRGTGLQAYNRAKKSIKSEMHYRLDTNYRSREILVDALNHLFLPVFNHSAGNTAPVGYQEIQSGHPGMDELIWPDSEFPLALYPVEEEKQGAQLICAEIRRMLDPDAGASWQDSADETRPLQASDIAVLVRKRKQEDDIINLLKDSGIPAIRFRSRSVFQQAIVAPLCGLLEAIDKPQYTALWRSVLLDDFFQVTPDILLVCEQDGTLDAFSENAQQWKNLFLQGKPTLALNNFFQYAAGLETIGEANSFPWPKRILLEEQNTWQDWRQLLELIQRKASDGLRDIPGLLEWIRSSANEEMPDSSDHAVRLETESEAVRVMTMHTSKGLQFPLVFIHGGYSQKPQRSKKPYRFEKEGTLHIDRLCREENYENYCAYSFEEDKRLWYVALTRAAYKVWVPIPSSESKGKTKFLDQFWKLALEQDTNLADPALRKALLQRAGSLQNEKKILHVLEPDFTPADKLPLLQAQIVKNPPIPEKFAGYRDPATSSYTSLSKIDVTAHYEKEAWEESEETIPLQEEYGSVFGSLLHSFLEECDFSLAADDDENCWMNNAAMDELFSAKAKNYYPPEWYNAHRKELKRLVRMALRCPIPGLGRLCDLDASQRRTEVAFQFAVPKACQLDIDNKNVQVEQGFIKGFIDLLICHEHKWWVIDWKTNLPQQNTDSWSQNALKELMNHHQYHFQYELYLLSLCRTLSVNLNQPVNWDTDIGAAVYLFLRGLNEENKSGIFWNKPKKEHMLNLANSMGFKDCIK